MHLYAKTKSSDEVFIVWTYDREPDGVHYYLLPLASGGSASWYTPDRVPASEIAVARRNYDLVRSYKCVPTQDLPLIGQPWPEQGGIYVGSRIIEGVLCHRVTPEGTEYDIENLEFKDIVTWRAVDINGYSDWGVPELEDLMLAWVSAREHFQKGVYWSKTVRDGWPWVLDFEDGYTTRFHRNGAFLVRPFRNIT